MVDALIGPADTGQPLFALVCTGGTFPIRTSRNMVHWNDSGAAPTGAVSFNVGDTLLGVAQLTPSGSSMLATLSISTSQLQYGANTVTAIYDGDRIFNGSSASITIDAGLPIGESAVIPSINPAPVFESPLTANLWRYTVKLTEAAGVATVITDYIVNGVSHIDELTTAFGGATLPARGSLSANRPT